jgi:hypothetical protein
MKQITPISNSGINPPKFEFQYYSLKIDSRKDQKAEK